MDTLLTEIMMSFCQRTRELRKMPERRSAANLSRISRATTSARSAAARLARAKGALRLQLGEQALPPPQHFSGVPVRVGSLKALATLPVRGGRARRHCWRTASDLFGLPR